jgi:hypothetical protein
VKAGPKHRPRVIVRAWGDEPVSMFLHAIANKRLYVGQQNSDTAIGLPFGQVFLFDEVEFSIARAAFDAGDTRKLTSIYEQLQNNPCNRYQNLWKLLHDQENITDPKNVASGSER